MKRFDIDLVAFEKDDDAWLVIQFMYASNDFSRIAQIRNIVKRHVRKGPQCYKRTKAGNFLFSLNSYTANLLLSHVFEAYTLVSKITKKTQMYAVIKADNDLSLAFDGVKAYLDGTKTAAGVSPYDDFLRKWKNMRHTLFFHYDTNDAVIAPALTKVTTKYVDSSLYFGSTRLNQRSFFKPAWEVIDAVASAEFGYAYGAKNQAAISQIVSDAQKAMETFDEFARLLITKYALKYTA